MATLFQLKHNIKKLVTLYIIKIRRKLFLTVSKSNMGPIRSKKVDDDQKEPKRHIKISTTLLDRRSKGKIEVGDVLDSLNGVQICSSTKGRLRTIFKSCKGRPIVLTIIKAVYSDTKQIYFPIINLLRHVRIDPDVLKNRIDTGDGKAEDRISNKNNASGTGLKVTYMGCVQVGCKGDVKQIDKAVSNFLAPAISMTCDDGFKYEWVKKLVSFELGELGVRCVDPLNLEVVLKHSYMEISACGSVSSLPNYFAYIAGDEYCNLAKNFTCYIFFTKNSDTSYTILQSIGQGFHRTHFAV